MRPFVSFRKSVRSTSHRGPWERSPLHVPSAVVVPCAPFPVTGGPCRTHMGSEHRGGHLPVSPITRWVGSASPELQCPPFATCLGTQGTDQPECSCGLVFCAHVLQCRPRGAGPHGSNWVPSGWVSDSCFMRGLRMREPFTFSGRSPPPTCLLVIKPVGPRGGPGRGGGEESALTLL